MKKLNFRKPREGGYYVTSVQGKEDTQVIHRHQKCCSIFVAKFAHDRKQLVHHWYTLLHWCKKMSATSGVRKIWLLGASDAALRTLVCTILLLLCILYFILIIILYIRI